MQGSSDWFERLLMKAYLSLAGAAACIIFVATKVLSFVATKECLPRQNFRDKIMFVATKNNIFVVFRVAKKTCFVATNTCLSQRKFCLNESLLHRAGKQ